MTISTETLRDENFDSAFLVPAKGSTLWVNGVRIFNVHDVKISTHQGLVTLTIEDEKKPLARVHLRDHNQLHVKITEVEGRKLVEMTVI